MRKISLNLASCRRVDRPAFVLRVAPLVLAAMLLAGLAAVHFSSRLGREGRAEEDAASSRQRLEEIRRAGIRLRSEINSQKRALGGRLSAANALIGLKSFSFIRRLDFLEAIAGAGIRVQQLMLTNESAGRVSMVIAAQTLKDLFDLYKKLAPYDLAIASETQSQDEYQVRLNFCIPNEKI